MALAPGDKVDRFVLLSRIGRGKHGEVFRADDEKLRRHIAIKVFDAATAIGRAALVKQAIRASGITHRNVVQIFEVGVADEHAFVAMELAGEPLARVIPSRGASMPERIVWLVEAARAIAAGHDRGVIHRNVSIENVLVREDGTVKVTDFALDAASAAPSARVDVHAETIALHDDAVDTGLDVRAWGRVAYEALAGRPPEDRATALDAIVPEVSRQVASVVARAMEVTAEAPFASMHEAADALSSAVVAEMSAPEASSRVPLGLAVALIGAVAFAGVALLMQGPARAIAHSSPNDAGAIASAIVDAGDEPEPEPTSSMPEALALYRAGTQGIRDGADRSAIANFVRATEIDPQFAAAHLRAVIYWTQPEEEEREQMRKATELRAQLSPRDRTLRDAFEPWVTEPQDGIEAERRLSAAALARPNDAEIAYHLCHIREALGRYADAIPACEAVLHIDDTFAGAWRYYGVALALLDRTDEAMTAFQRCLAISPQATSCTKDLYLIEAQRGECAEVLVSARRELAADPANAEAYERLANALYASSAPIESVHAAVDQQIKYSPEHSRRNVELLAESELAIAAGDFDLARGKLDALDRALRLASHEGNHVDALTLRLTLDRELRRDEELAQTAKRYLDERAAWTPYTAGDDPSISAFDALYLAGRTSRADFVRERDAWMARERASTARGGLWGSPLAREWWLGYAHPARDRGDADEAIAVLPSHLPMLAAIVQRTPYMLDVGDAFALAEKPAEAEAWLRRATHACWALSFPVESVRAHAHLAKLLEAKGAREEACSEYAWVLARWPASTHATSAIDAAAGRQRLACAK